MNVWARMGICALILAGVWVGSARGAVIIFPLVEEFSGATPPAALMPPAWLTVTVDDGVDDADGEVTLTLAATNLTGGEHVKVWNLNLDPALDPTKLSFSAPIQTGLFDDPGIALGQDAYKADGDGWFDIEFAFTEGGSDKRFGVGEAAQYTVTFTGVGLLMAESFDFCSQPGDSLLVAAHVGGIGESGDDSGWITVPEPATVGLMAVGFGALAALRQRRRK